MEEALKELEAEIAAFEDVFKDLSTGNMKQEKPDFILKPKSILLTTKEKPKVPPKPKITIKQAVEFRNAFNLQIMVMTHN